MAQASPVQQMCHLKEFFIVHHLREKEFGVGGGDDLITIPRFVCQESVLQLDGDAGADPADDDYERLRHLYPRNSWRNLERVILETVRGSEVMFLSKTCQDVFTPVSNNGLVPQVTAGEPVRLIVPVCNDVQSDLLMKNVCLNWKFVPAADGASPVVYGGKKNCAKSEADKFVKAEVSKYLLVFLHLMYVLTYEVVLVFVFQVLPQVTLAKGATSRLSLRLRICQPGELYVTGVEYSLRAQYPQTESTDYSIEGRQAFSISGPRLTSTKEHKTSQVYGADNRLRLKAIDGRPKLSFHVEDMPAELRQGELKSVVLSLTNESGAVDVDRVYLVCPIPGFASFGSRTSAQYEKKALFAHPVVDDDSLSSTQENGQTNRTKLDLLAVPLKGPLKAGQSIKLPLWIRGPIGLGQNLVRFHVFYARGDNYCIVTRDLAFKTIPAVTVSAVWSDVCVYDDRAVRSRNVVVHLSNIGKGEDANKSVEVTQVSLVSHTDRLKHMESKSSDTLKVHRADSAALCVKLERATSDGWKASKPESTVHFSSVSSRDEKDEKNIQSPPFLDFLKPGFDFDSERRKLPPRLREDLVVVFWKSSTATGMLVTPLRKCPTPAAGQPKDATDGDKDGSQWNRTSMPCKAVVSLSEGVQSPLKHDFSKSRLLVVPCSMTISNTGDKRARVSLKTTDKLEDNGGVVVLGSVSHLNVTFEPGETKAYHFRLAVTSPGVYRCKAFGLQASPETGSAPSAKKRDTAAVQQRKTFAPLEVSFVVIQQQSRKLSGGN